MANTMLDRVTNGKRHNANDQRDEPMERMIQSIYATRERNDQLEAENATLRSALEAEQAARKIAENREAVSSMKLEAARDIVAEQRRVDMSALASRIGEIGDAIDNGKEVYDTEEPR